MTAIYKSDINPLYVAVGYDSHAGRYNVGTGTTKGKAVKDMNPDDMIDKHLEISEVAYHYAGPCTLVGSRRIEILTSRPGDCEDVVQFI